MCSITPPSTGSRLPAGSSKKPYGCTRLGSSVLAKQLATSFVGQGVGLIDGILDTRTVVREVMEDYLTAVERMSATLH